jgi:2-oxoglutarate ferredoxin oxidoreductase subunit delta
MSKTITQKKKPAVSKGRPQIDPEACKGCELCVAACPEGALRLSSRANSQGVPYAEYDPNAVCTACKSCAIVCPDAAIQVYRFETGEKSDG